MEAPDGPAPELLLSAEPAFMPLSLTGPGPLPPDELSPPPLRVLLEGVLDDVGFCATTNAVLAANMTPAAAAVLK
jgi:hypothetical protein